MLKQTVNYEDFDGNQASDTLYFNLSKAEILDHMDLQHRFEHLQEVFSGEKRELNPEEVRLMLDMVKDLMRLSYGVKSADGKRFKKSDELWEEFTQTAVYDSFLVSLFTDAERAVDFVINIFPKDLIAQVDMSTVELPTAPPVVLNDSPFVKDAQKDISDEDLLKMNPIEMTQEQLLRAFQLKSK